MFTVYIPTATYLRAELFCEEVNETLAEEGIRANYSIEKLVYVLYSDFLIYCKKARDMDAIYQSLKDREHFITTKEVNKRSLERKENTNDDFSNTNEGFTFVVPEKLEDVGKESIYSIKEQHDVQKIIVSIKRKKALEGEIILQDLSDVREHPFTLENVLEISICDFIENYRLGYIQNAIERIVSNMN